jgi:hypothetical protein
MGGGGRKKGRGEEGGGERIEGKWGEHRGQRAMKR